VNAHAVVQKLATMRAGDDKARYLAQPPMKAEDAKSAWSPFADGSVYVLVVVTTNHSVIHQVGGMEAH
jgi:hypothetical protein